MEKLSFIKLPGSDNSMAELRQIADKRAREDIKQIQAGNLVTVASGSRNLIRQVDENSDFEFTDAQKRITVVAENNIPALLSDVKLYGLSTTGRYNTNMYQVTFSEQGGLKLHTTTYPQTQAIITLEGYILNNNNGETIKIRKQQYKIPSKLQLLGVGDNRDYYSLKENQVYRKNGFIDFSDNNWWSGTEINYASSENGCSCFKFIIKKQVQSYLMPKLLQNGGKNDYVLCTHFPYVTELNRPDICVFGLSEGNKSYINIQINFKTAWYIKKLLRPVNASNHEDITVANAIATLKNKLQSLKTQLVYQLAEPYILSSIKTSLPKFRVEKNKEIHEDYPNQRQMPSIFDTENDDGIQRRFKFKKVVVSVSEIEENNFDTVEVTCLTDFTRANGAYSIVTKKGVPMNVGDHNQLVFFKQGVPVESCFRIVNDKDYLQGTTDDDRTVPTLNVIRNKINSITAEPPIYIDDSRRISLKYGFGLKVVNGELQVDIDAIRNALAGTPVTPPSQDEDPTTTNFDIGILTSDAIDNLMKNENHTLGDGDTELLTIGNTVHSINDDAIDSYIAQNSENIFGEASYGQTYSITSLNDIGKISDQATITNYFNETGE